MVPVVLPVSQGILLEPHLRPVRAVKAEMVAYMIRIILTVIMVVPVRKVKVLVEVRAL